MKKAKLISVIAILLLVVMSFNACGATAHVKQFLNKNYNPFENVYTSTATFSDLTNYTILKSNNNFVIFTYSTENFNSYKVFSMNAKRIIATFADSKYSFEFDIFDTVPVLLVSKLLVQRTVSVDDDQEDDNSNVYIAYDSNGDVLKTVKDEKPSDPIQITFDTCVFDNEVYKIKPNGTISKAVDIKNHFHPDAYNDDYYYKIDGNSVTVCDHSFNTISSFVAPSNYENISTFVLNNGNVLAQYVYKIAEGERRYDIEINDDSYQNGKYDLVSLIIDAKSGKTQEINLDYIITDCLSNYEANHYYEFWNKTSPYTENFENIAVIVPIVNKQLEENKEKCDLVFMNNKGKALRSIKVVDNQTPSLDSVYKIGNDRYRVNTLSGFSVIDSKKNIIQSTTDTTLKLYGAYFVNEKAIYNLNLEPIYDLNKNNVEDIQYIKNTIFVKKITRNGYDMISFCNGDQTTVYTSNDNSSFELIENIGYVLIDKQSGDYKYYNSEGSLLVTTTYMLETVTSSSNNTVIMMSSNVGSKIYHTFTAPR